MIDYTDFFDYIFSTKLSTEIDSIRELLDNSFKNSNVLHWQGSIKNFPVIIPSVINLDQSIIQIGDSKDCSDQERSELRDQLLNLRPWRKGPYNFFGNFIDTEWRSDWKWDRIKDFITPLNRRNVLDVGCGNGYHCWRMIGAGAGSVLGIDPFLLNVFQFNANKNFMKEKPCWVLPIKMEQFPQSSNYFDTVFSMGILYHRRSPFDHLIELKNAIRNGGELILETLVIDGKQGEVLIPEDRYAKMRNVWFIPSTLTLELWMKRIGFKNVRLIDTTKTTTDEQRSTDWMKFESLSDFLDPENSDLTIEGHPAPKRAIFIANS